MNPDVLSYASEACSTDAALSPAAISTDVSQLATPKAQGQAPTSSATSNAANDAQKLRSVRGEPDKDPVAFAIALVQKVKAADGRLQAVCDAITARASAAPGTFAGGFTAGLGNGLYRAARDWLVSILDLAKGVWAFFADTSLESAVALLVRGLATAVALELSKTDEGVQLLQTIATQLAQVAGQEKSADQTSELLLLTSAQLAAVAEWIQTLRGATAQDTLAMGIEFIEVIVDYCLTALEQGMCGDALAVSLQLGEIVGRCLGEIALFAMGL